MGDRHLKFHELRDNSDQQLDVLGDRSDQVEERSETSAIMPGRWAMLIAAGQKRRAAMEPHKLVAGMGGSGPGAGVYLIGRGARPHRPGPSEGLTV